MRNVNIKAKQFWRIDKMLIFFQEIGLQLILWMLQLIDGIMEIFSAISGVATVNYHGEQVNII